MTAPVSPSLRVTKGRSGMLMPPVMWSCHCHLHLRQALRSLVSQYKFAFYRP